MKNGSIITNYTLNKATSISGRRRYFCYIFFFAVLMMIALIGQFDLADGEPTLERYLGIITVFDLLLVEFCVLLLLATWLLGGNLFSRLLLYLLTFLFTAIYTIQFSSFYMVKEFVSRLALDNLNHFELLISTKAIISSTVFFILFCALMFSVEKSVKNQIPTFSAKILKTLLLFTLAILILQSHYWLPEKVGNQRYSILKENLLTNTAPITSFVQALITPDTFSEDDNLPTHFSRYELEVLKEYGFHYNAALEYPLVKETVYSTPAPFGKIEGSSPSPNIIVFFTEGFSARSMTAYGTQYKNITPNLDGFSQNSMVVDNYFNHTGATYRGLHGQLCSLFPTYGGSGGWQSNYEDIPDTNYLCISDIFNRNEYDTIFLDAHKPDAAQVDEMVTRLGFQEVITGNELLEKYIPGDAPKRRDSISDKQFYMSLVGFLKERVHSEKNDAPFFMGLYNLGTHAFLSIPEDGSTYGGGENRSLNKVHTLDAAFGIFWDYYQESPYAENTIVIFTADHCHYPEKPFIEAFDSPDYQPVFVDRIPLIIHDPTRSLPDRYDARYSTSIGFTPSLLHFLDLGNHQNPFLGSSIFEKNDPGMTKPGLNSYGNEIYLTASDGIHNYRQPDSFPIDFEILRKFVRASKKLEMRDKIWDPTLNQ